MEQICSHMYSLTGIRCSYVLLIQAKYVVRTEICGQYSEIIQNIRFVAVGLYMISTQSLNFNV